MKKELFKVEKNFFLQIYNCNKEIEKQIITIMNKIQFVTKEGPAWLSPEDIVVLHIEDQQLKLELESGTTLLLNGTLRNYMTLLQAESDRFFSLGRAVLINLQYVFRYANGIEKKVLLENGMDFPVPPRKKVRLLKAMAKDD